MAGARKTSILNRVALADFQSSTKIEALREELHRMLQRDPSAKALVFSQFTSMLDLIFFRLQQVSRSCRSCKSQFRDSGPCRVGRAVVSPRMLLLCKKSRVGIVPRGNFVRLLEHSGRGACALYHCTVDETS